jgi:hypothetical protein
VITAQLRVAGPPGVRITAFPHEMQGTGIAEAGLVHTTAHTNKARREHFFTFDPLPKGSEGAECAPRGGT